MFITFRAVIILTFISFIANAQIVKNDSSFVIAYCLTPGLNLNISNTLIDQKILLKKTTLKVVPDDLQNINKVENDIKGLSFIIDQKWKIIFDSVATESVQFASFSFNLNYLNIRDPYADIYNYALIVKPENENKIFRVTDVNRSIDRANNILIITIDTRHLLNGIYSLGMGCYIPIGASWSVSPDNKNCSACGNWNMPIPPVETNDIHIASGTLLNACKIKHRNIYLYDGAYIENTLPSQKIIHLNKLVTNCD
ncbi:MAG: hypothetical protein WCO28_03990 [Bacteroidota bacterium]